MYSVKKGFLKNFTKFTGKHLNPMPQPAIGASVFL